MIRKIIQIDEAKCSGCGACASACHEGAIGMVGGKAKLLRDNYCDGLGDCLPVCPTGAITFVMREAAAYDETAVLQSKKAQGQPAASAAAEHRTPAASGDAPAAAHPHEPCGCPGSKLQILHTAETSGSDPIDRSELSIPSELAQWPCQIRLIPADAPCFEGADLLIAADCTAYAYADMHRNYMRGRVTLIGCPKLDSVDYAEKLTDILRRNTIRSVTVVRMEVPCCGGLEAAVRKAIQNSEKDLSLRVAVITTNGRVLE